MWVDISIQKSSCNAIMRRNGPRNAGGKRGNRACSITDITDGSSNEVRSCGSKHLPTCAARWPRPRDCRRPKVARAHRPRTVPSPPTEGSFLSLETRNLSMGRAGAGIIAFGLAMACVLLALPGCEGFYLPGVAPQDFALGDIIQPRVGRVSSAKTHIPFGERSRPQARAPPLPC